MHWQLLPLFTGASAVSGFFASACSLPFDYVKTQIQKMQPDANGKYPYTGSLDCAMKTFKAGGPFKFYTGFPVYCVRIAPHVMVWGHYILLLLQNLNFFHSTLHALICWHMYFGCDFADDMDIFESNTETREKSWVVGNLHFPYKSWVLQFRNLYKSVERLFEFLSLKQHLRVFPFLHCSVFTLKNYQFYWPRL